MANEYVIDGTLGAKLDEVLTSADWNSGNGQGASHTVGTVALGSKNSKWMYIQAASAIAQYSVVGITGTNTAVPLTTTNVNDTSNVGALGVAQVSIASSSYGWVALEGNNVLCNLAANCADNVKLFTTATGGVLDDATVTNAYIAGVRALTSISNATAVTCNFYPKLVSFGSI